MALIMSLFATGVSHPTLPLMWTAKVKEAEVGVVDESYIFVDKPTPDNPSAKWTNFTDGSCQRLIWVGNNYDEARYLLGCDAVDCCTEDQSGNHKEYQIPDVHPAFLAPVKSLGKQSITLFNKSTIEADAWSWRFAFTSTVAYTSGSTLLRWNVSAAGNSFVNDYADFTVPKTSDQIAAFKSQFRIPDVCQGPQVMKCDGQVSQQSMAFLRAGSTLEHQYSATERNTFSASAIRKAASHKPPSTQSRGLTQATKPTVHAGLRDVKTLLFVNDSRVVGGGYHSELISLDLTTTTMRKMSTSLPAAMDYVSASVVCGSTYYAVATSAPIAEGLLVVDVASGNATIQQTEGNLAHALACSPTSGKLLMVVSAFTRPRTTFSLREYDVSSQTTTVLYTFPRSTLWGGWDSIFSFAKTGELWATFPLGNDILKQRRGELYVVDTASGAVKEHKTVGHWSSPGEPYMILPGEGDRFLWMLAAHGEASAAQDLQLCTADKSGATIQVTNCKKAASLWDIGATPAVCNGAVYVGGLSSGGKTPIYEITPSGTFDLVTTVDVQSEEYNFGTLTCGTGTSLPTK